MVENFVDWNETSLIYWLDTYDVYRKSELNKEVAFEHFSLYDVNVTFPTYLLFGFISLVQLGEASLRENVYAVYEGLHARSKIFGWEDLRVKPVLEKASEDVQDCIDTYIKDNLHNTS